MPATYRKVLFILLDKCTLSPCDYLGMRSMRGKDENGMSGCGRSDAADPLLSPRHLTVIFSPFFHTIVYTIPTLLCMKPQMIKSAVDEIIEVSERWGPSDVGATLVYTIIARRAQIVGLIYPSKSASLTFFTSSFDARY